MTKPHKILALSTLIISFTASCASNPPQLNELFHSNTKRDIVDYDHNARKDYRNYLHLKKVREKEKEKEILESLEDDD